MPAQAIARQGRLGTATDAAVHQPTAVGGCYDASRWNRSNTTGSGGILEIRASAGSGPFALIAEMESA
jgi:hypothetical protein